MPSLLYPSYFPFCIISEAVQGQVFTLVEVMQIYWKVKSWSVSFNIDFEGQYNKLYQRNTSFTINTTLLNSTKLYCNQFGTGYASWSGNDGVPYDTTYASWVMGGTRQNGTNYSIGTPTNFLSFSAINAGGGDPGTSVSVYGPIAELGVETYYTIKILNKYVPAKVFYNFQGQTYELGAGGSVDVSATPLSYWDYS